MCYTATLRHCYTATLRHCYTETQLQRWSLVAHPVPWMRLTKIFPGRDSNPDLSFWLFIWDMNSPRVQKIFNDPPHNKKVNETPQVIFSHFCNYLRFPFKSRGSMTIRTPFELTLKDWRSNWKTIVPDLNGQCRMGAMEQSLIGGQAWSAFFSKAIVHTLNYQEVMS